MDFRHRISQPGYLIAFFTIIVWGATLSFDFVWDDFPMIAMNSSLHHWETLVKGWVNDFWMLHDSPQPSGYWRPLPTMLHVLLTQLTGGAAWVFHAVNVILHGLVSYFFYQFLVQIKWVKWFWISVIFFLWHPLASETVSFSSAVPDLLSACFGWWAVAFWMNPKESKSKLTVALLLLALSFLSKESGIFFGVFILGIEWILKRDEPRQHRKKISIAVIGAIVAYTMMHFFVTSGIGARTMWGGNALTHLATVCKLFAHELFLIFVPIGSSPTRDFDLGAWNQWDTWVGLVLLVGFVGSFFYFFNRKRYISFTIFFYLVFWFPVSNIIPAEGLITNRYMYIPSMVAALMFGSLFNRFDQFPKVVGLGLSAWGFWACSEALAWKNSEMLWSHAIQASPKSSVAWNERGNLLASERRYVEALEAYEKAVNLRYNYKDASYNRAMTLFLMKDVKTAEAIQKHLRVFPEDPQALDLLGSVYEAQGDLVNAELASRKAVLAEPDQWKYRFNLASVYIKLKNYDKAIQELEVARSFVPDRYEVLKNLAAAYCLNAKYQDCMVAYETLMKKFPNQSEEFRVPMEQARQLFQLTQGS